MSDKAAGWKDIGHKSEEAGEAGGMERGRGELRPAKFWGKKSLIPRTSVLRSSSADLNTDKTIRILSLGDSIWDIMNCDVNAGSCSGRKKRKRRDCSQLALMHQLNQNNKLRFYFYPGSALA